MSGIEASTCGINKLLKCINVRVMYLLLTYSKCYDNCILEPSDKIKIDLTIIHLENWCFVVIVE